MSGHDDLGFDDLGPGDGLGPGRDVLKQTIGALVDGATSPGVPSGPEENLGRLRRRVRTWRIAKAGAVGVGTAVVIGTLAFSAAQASTWTRSEPLPGRPTVHATDSGPMPSEVPTTRVSQGTTASPSPSPSPSDVPVGEPTPDPSASSTGEATGSGTAAGAWPPFEPFDEGYAAWDLGRPIACGMAIEDLPADPVRFTVQANDAPADRQVSGFTITEVAGESHELASGRPPEYLLFQDGRMVSSSDGPSDGGFWAQDEQTVVDGPDDTYEPVTPGQTWELGDAYAVGLEDFSTCGEQVYDDQFFTTDYLTPLPAGEYEIVFVAPYSLRGEPDSFQFAYSDPYPVTYP
ncbi:hypothetical protein GCM10010413_41500 [Promicromonospora sukumoe]|uniref:Uncharacterized protein n=1 Tax=Promicromonospora sukumoe TaxID=88382 RepID=A0A7W3JE31_9MICO|nr:hypothetical protein [Promicromonospora sukumoe]MBA8811143.1 hypothetical protein [Promicromonospora sukumoe]